MKITKIETIHLQHGITVHAGAVSWLWVRIHTDEGLVGLGETYPAGQSAEAVILHSLSDVLLGRDCHRLERLWADMLRKVGWAGSEMRAISAIDIALWDLLGKKTGQPIYQLLGGKSRDSIRTYDTCYDHVYDFNTDGDKMAQDLLKMGIGAMKIWPFDATALRNQGNYITNAELEICLAPVRKIRDAVGDSMELAMEFHGYWNLPSAVKIAKALEPFGILWLEEILPQNNMEAYKRLSKETSIPLCLSERLQHFASIHLAMNVSNLFILESVRRHYLKEYQGLVTSTCPLDGGEFKAPDLPGLGVELHPSVYSRPDVTIHSAVVQALA